MSPETHKQLANFIWSICNLLRGPYKRNEYRKVILPMTVLRRFDCLLAPTKAKVIERNAAIRDKPEKVVHSLLTRRQGALSTTSPSSSSRRTASIRFSATPTSLRQT